MRVLWLTDPWTALDHSVDTSLRLMAETYSCGIDCLWGNFYDVSISDRRTIVPAKKVAHIREFRGPDDFTFCNSKILDISACDFVMLRADPPINPSFMNIAQMLTADVERLRSRPRLINPPHVLLGINSKIAGCMLQGTSRQSMITADVRLARQFGMKTGKTVMKSLNVSQSHGVSVLYWTTMGEQDRSSSAFEAATQMGRVPMMLQPYFDSGTTSEIRQWFVDGVLIATVKKVAGENQDIFDLCRGGRVVGHTPNEAELALAGTVGAFLRKSEIGMAAVDSIEGNVIDVNVVSPGLLVEMEMALGVNLAELIIRRVFLDATN